MLTLASAAIKSGKNPSEAYVLRGQARQHLGDLKGATDDFKSALRIDPQNINAKLGLDILEWGSKTKKSSR